MALKDRKIWDNIAKSRTKGRKKPDPTQEYLDALILERDEVAVLCEEAKNDIYRLMHTARIGSADFETARAKLVVYSGDLQWFTKEIARVRKGL